MDLDLNINADELECDSSSICTLNFSILPKDVIRIDDDEEGEEDEAELRLFPMPRYWLNLSVPSMEAQLPANNQPRKSRRGPRSRSSQYRGVTFYRRTGRWESHIWDCGKQVYLGGFDTAHAAARAYDRAAIKFRGVDADINFNVGDYQEDMKQMNDFTKQEFVHILRRQSSGFSRGYSKYRAASPMGLFSFPVNKGYNQPAFKSNWKEEVNGSSLDLNLGISLSSEATSSSSQELPMSSKYPYSGFTPTSKDRFAAKGSGGMGSVHPSNWAWKMQSSQVQFLSAAASSGFSATTSPTLFTSRSQHFPSTAVHSHQ